MLASLRHLRPGRAAALSRIHRSSPPYPAPAPRRCRRLRYSQPSARTRGTRLASPKIACPA
eukprot:1118062-Prymnesium_polylepis.3